MNYLFICLAAIDFIYLKELRAGMRYHILLCLLFIACATTIEEISYEEEIPIEEEFPAPIQELKLTEEENSCGKILTDKKGHDILLERPRDPLCNPDLFEALTSEIRLINQNTKLARFINLAKDGSFDRMAIGKNIRVKAPMHDAIKTDDIVILIFNANGKHVFFTESVEKYDLCLFNNAETISQLPKNAVFDIPYDMEEYKLNYVVDKETGEIYRPGDCFVIEGKVYDKTVKINIVAELIRMQRLKKS